MTYLVRIGQGREAPSMEENLTSIGPIMKAARKFRKLNQSEVAHAIGCSQSALSKMEHNLLVPSAPQWFRFSRFTSIPPETLETGIIDRHSLVKFNNQDVSLGFKIPKRFRPSKSLKIREIYPFLHALELSSPFKMKEFMESTGIEAEFFLDFDNLINFHLVEDLIRFYLTSGMGGEADLKYVVENGQNELFWDDFRNEWGQLKNVREVLNAYADRQLYYQMDFFLKVEGTDDSVNLSYFPEYHLKQLHLYFTQEMINFLNLYRKLTIESLLKKVLGKEVKVSLLQETHASPLAAKFLVQQT